MSHIDHMLTDDICWNKIPKMKFRHRQLTVVTQELLARIFRARKITNFKFVSVIGLKCDTYEPK